MQSISEMEDERPNLLTLSSVIDFLLFLNWLIFQFFDTNGRCCCLTSEENMSIYIYILNEEIYISKNEK